MRINVHVHVFNLAAVKTEWGRDRLRKRLEYDTPGRLGELAGSVAAGILDTIPDLNEARLLRKILRALGAHDLVSDLPSGVEDLLVGALRRLVDRAIDRLRRHPADRDHREADLHDIVETLRIAALPSVADVTDWVMRQLGPEDAIVPLMMDITDGKSDVEGKARFHGSDGEDLCELGADTPLFVRQLCDTSDVILRYPGRVLPFVKVHAKRPDHFEIMQRALERHGFVGVKLYPSLAFDYKVDSVALKRVYAYCQERGIPLLMHCNKGGFVGELDDTVEPPVASSVNADPNNWLPVLAEFPRLKICFAHFGGPSPMTRDLTDDEPSLPASDPEGNRSWSRNVLDLTREHPGVYADVAFHRTPMDSDRAEANYFQRLGLFLQHADYRDKILFGTDFWFIRPRLREANHWRFFEKNLLARDPGGTTYGRLARDNPSRFLGLPGSGETNAAVGAYVDFIVREQTRLGERPAEWVLRAIEESEKHGPEVRRRIEEHTESLPARRFLGVSWSTLLNAAGARDLTQDFDEDLDRGIEARTDLLGIPIRFEAGGKLRVRVFNKEDQTDPDAVLFKPPPEDLSPLERRLLELRHGPQLHYRDDTAWLKYRLEASLSADARARAGLARLEASAERTFVFADYRAHRRDESLVGAIRQDLRRPRFALSRDDVLNLGIGDALAFKTRGKLGAGISLSWQDVFSSGLDELSQLLETPQIIMLRVDVGASVSGSVEIEDDFRVVFARHEDGWIRVAVRKIKATDKAFKVKFQAGLQLENPDVLTRALEQFLAQRLGEAVGKIERLRADATAALEDDPDLLERLEARLAVEGLERVQEELSALTEDFLGKFEAIVSQRLEAGFTYEYNRLETNATLLEADAKDRVVEELHAQLVDGDLSGLIARHRQGDEDEVDLIEYLRFEEIVRRRAWGFHLGPLQGTDIQEMTFRKHVDVDDAEKLAFVGERGYRGRWIGGDWHWEVDLKAHMNHFLPNPDDDPVTASAFEYGLGFLFKWDRKLNKTALQEVIDAALLWGAVPADADVAAIQDRLEQEELLGKDVSARLQLLFGHEVLAHETLDRVLPGENLTFEDNLEALAAALAAAMPYGRADTHRNPQARRETYSRLWKDFLTEASESGFIYRPRDTAKTWGEKAAGRLRASGLPTAARYEEQGFPTSDRWDHMSLAGNLYLNGFPVPPLRDFHQGLSWLRKVWRPLTEDPPPSPSDETYKAIESTFGQLKGFWRQSLHVRAAGAFLHERARAAGVLDKVKASLTIQRVDGEKEVIVGLPRR